MLRLSLGQQIFFMIEFVFFLNYIVNKNIQFHFKKWWWPWSLKNV